jgi:hypothetical protein
MYDQSMSNTPKMQGHESESQKWSWTRLNKQEEWSDNELDDQ